MRRWTGQMKTLLSSPKTHTNCGGQGVVSQKLSYFFFGFNMKPCVCRCCIFFVVPLLATIFII